MLAESLIFDFLRGCLVGYKDLFLSPAGDMLFEKDSPLLMRLRGINDFEGVVHGDKDIGQGVAENYS